MSDANTYVIKGGIAGRERLRILARAMAPTTNALLDRVGALTGMRGLDAGCGGGDVTRELAARVGPSGHVTGVDLDETKLQLCRDECGSLGNMDFRAAMIGKDDLGGPFDFIYSRFLLTHLTDPGSAVREFHTQLKPGGLVILEDIDFSGYLAEPFSAAQRRYCDLYCAAVRKRGADPDIGPKLPAMIQANGFSQIQSLAVTPVGLTGDVKLVTPITAENITEAVVASGLATADAMKRLAEELYREAGDPATLFGMPRVVQTWGRRQ